MNWYKLSSAPRPIKYTIRNDFAKANVDFEEYGHWFMETFENIPIDKIEYNPWSPERSKDNLEKIRATKSMPPVIAYYDEGKDKFSLTDGNHRTYAAKELGYTHVPAIVTRKRTDKPPFDDKTEQTKMEQLGWKLGQMIRNINPIDMVHVEGTTKDFIKLNIGIYNTDADHEYIAIIVPKNNFYDVKLTKKQTGKEMDFSGTLEQIAQKISANIERAK